MWILRPKGLVHTKTTLYETTIALYECINFANLFSTTFWNYRACSGVINLAIVFHIKSQDTKLLLP